MQVIKNKRLPFVYLLSAVLLPLLSYAQLPIMFDSNYVSYYLFENANGATTSVGGRLQYHFVQQAQQLDTLNEFKFNKHLDEPNSPDGCNKLTRPSFAGNYARINNEGNITVYNRNVESVFFNLSAMIDSTWTMYENRSQNTTIKAKTIAVTDSVIFDVVNEVKAIQIIFYDTLGKEKKQEKYNRFVFLHSNKFGFLRLYHLGSFPSTCNNSSYDTCAIFIFSGYQNMAGTVKHGKTFFHLNELHDYEVGDEFHWESEHNSQYLYRNIKTINTCLLKQEINDSLIFTFKEREYSLINDRQGAIPKQSDIVVEREHQIKRPVFNAKPFNKIKYRENQQAVYSCNPMEELDEYYWNHHYYFYRNNDTDTCFGFLHSNDFSIGYLYRGIYGVTIPFYVLGSGYKKVVYYKKGSKTWGTPLPQNIGLNEMANNKKVSVYPNPTNKNAVIDLAYVKRVIIHNALGKKVDASTTLNQHAVEVNAEALINGIYYIELITENNTSRCTLVVKH